MELKLQNDGVPVPRGAKARRKHPHFTHSELALLVERFIGCEDNSDASRVYFKAKAALFARGIHKVHINAASAGAGKD